MSFIYQVPKINFIFILALGSKGSETSFQCLKE